MKQNILTTSNFSALFGSSANESTWEIDKYKHGAFTQALLEAFDNKTVECNGVSEKCNSNTDPDRFLTFKELVDFVKKRVPYIVKENSKGLQNPSVQDFDSNKDIPIFWFNK